MSYLKSRSLMLGLILIASLLTGCSVSVATPTLAEIVVTATSRPTPKPAPPTPTPLPTPTPTPTPTSEPTPTPTATALPSRLEGFEGIRKIRVIVEQFCSEIEGEFSVPVAETCQRILERVGFEVVGEAAAEYDATLEITFTGTALGADYSAGYLYTGAELEGSFSLSVPGQGPYEKPFSVKKSPPMVVLYSPEEPRDAPFGSIWQKPFFLAIHDVWGLQPAIQALGDEDRVVQEGAVEALAEIGLEAVPALIEALKDENVDVCNKSVLALGEIGPEAGVIPALIEMLTTEDWAVRGNAAMVLGRMGRAAEEAIPALEKALEDESVYARGEAERALKKIRGGE